ncbi:MAG: hypothetical protein P4L41_15210 [Flavipsychrobacter sp.]|nr:hypothetical protein [Flavipsychrobacter sp.]
MFSNLLFYLFFHSLFRWLVLASLIYAIYRAAKGYAGKAIFTKFDDKVRHYTATIAHIQLVLGILLYTQSPIIKYFMRNYAVAVHERETRFFGMEHITVMVTAIVCITIGSAAAKRKPNDRAKFKTMLIWFSIGLLLILTSVPWPFSPVVARPYFRQF